MSKVYACLFSNRFHFNTSVVCLELLLSYESAANTLLLIAEGAPNCLFRRVREG